MDLSDLRMAAAIFVTSVTGGALFGSAITLFLTGRYQTMTGVTVALLFVGVGFIAGAILMLMSLGPIEEDSE